METEASNCRGGYGTQRIRTAAAILVVVPVVETGSAPTYLEIRERAAHLHELGMSDKAIGRALGVSDKTVAKTIRHVRSVRRCRHRTLRRSPMLLRPIRIDSGRTSTARSNRTPPRIPDPRHPRGVIDTSVVIAIEQVAGGRAPRRAGGVGHHARRARGRSHAANDPAELARRQDRLQRTEATFEPIPFDAAAARAYGRVYAAITSTGRKARSRRAVDLLIAATALAANLPLDTRNPADFAGLESILEVVAVAPN